jgi:hypothetical protein
MRKISRGNQSGEENSGENSAETITYSFKKIPNKRS